MILQIARTGPPVNKATVPASSASLLAQLARVQEHAHQRRDGNGATSVRRLRRVASSNASDSPPHLEPAANTFQTLLAPASKRFKAEVLFQGYTYDLLADLPDLAMCDENTDNGEFTAAAAEDDFQTALTVDLSSLPVGSGLTTSYPNADTPASATSSISTPWRSLVFGGFECNEHKSAERLLLQLGLTADDATEDVVPASGPCTHLSPPAFPLAVAAAERELRLCTASGENPQPVVVDDVGSIRSPQTPRSRSPTTTQPAGDNPLLTPASYDAATPADGGSCPGRSSLDELPRSDQRRVSKSSLDCSEVTRNDRQQTPVAADYGRPATPPLRGKSPSRAPLGDESVESPLWAAKDLDEGAAPASWATRTPGGVPECVSSIELEFTSCTTHASMDSARRSGRGPDYGADESGAQFDRSTTLQQQSTLGYRHQGCVRVARAPRSCVTGVPDAPVEIHSSPSLEPPSSTPRASPSLDQLEPTFTFAGSDGDVGARDGGPPPATAAVGQPDIRLVPGRLGADSPAAQSHRWSQANGISAQGGGVQAFAHDSTAGGTRSKHHSIAPLCRPPLAMPLAQAHTETTADTNRRTGAPYSNEPARDGPMSALFQTERRNLFSRRVFFTGAAPLRAEAADMAGSARYRGSGNLNENARNLQTVTHRAPGRPPVADSTQGVEDEAAKLERLLWDRQQHQFGGKRTADALAGYGLRLASVPAPAVLSRLRTDPEVHWHPPQHHAEPRAGGPVRVTPRSRLQVPRIYETHSVSTPGELQRVPSLETTLQIVRGGRPPTDGAPASDTRPRLFDAGSARAAAVGIPGSSEGPRISLFDPPAVPSRLPAQSHIGPENSRSRRDSCLSDRLSPIAQLRVHRSHLIAEAAQIAPTAAMQEANEEHSLRGRARGTCSTADKLQAANAIWRHGEGTSDVTWVSNIYGEPGSDISTVAPGGSKRDLYARTDVGQSSVASTSERLLLPPGLPVATRRGRFIPAACLAETTASTSNQL